MKKSQRRYELNCAPTLVENNIVNSLIFAVFYVHYFHVSGFAKTGDRGVLPLLSSNPAGSTSLWPLSSR